MIERGLASRTACGHRLATVERVCSGDGAVGFRWVIHWSRIAVVMVRWGTGGSYSGAGLRW
jgi:hypothetical protein